MANGATDLGNGIGLIYQVKPNGTDILAAIPNNANGIRTAKLLAVQAASLSTNKRAVGSIVLSAVAGAGNVTAVTIDGVNQISANVAYVAGPLATIATDIAAAINSFTPASGPDYVAVGQNERVYIFAPVDQGSAVNGEAITVSTTGNLTFTTNDLTFGSNASSVFDEVTGYRFFVNADYSGTASLTSLTNAVEVTDYIVPRPLNTSFDTQEKTIQTNVINIMRKSALTFIVVDTQGGAGTDDLDNITMLDAAENDILVLFGANASRVVTFTSAGNINLVNAFSTADFDTSITLRFSAGTFYEIGRSGNNFVPSVAAFRTADYPFVITGAQGRAALTATDNTTVTLVANTNKKYQVVTGTATLSGGDYEIALDTTGVVDGDEFTIGYYGAVTIGSNNVVIGGVTLTEEEALYGGVVLAFVVNSGSWVQTGRFYDISVYPIQTDNIGDGQVAVTNLSEELTFEEIIVPVSFEANEVGDMKIRIEYACTVTAIYAAVSKAIAATDDATIVPKNNSGTTMGTGTITLPASTAIGTAVTSTPSTDNTFTAGQIMTLTTAKTTAGGKALVTIKVVRTL